MVEIVSTDSNAVYDICLNSIDSTDMDQVRKWRNDYRIWRWCRQNDLLSDYDQSAWFDRQSHDRSCKFYKVMEKMRWTNDTFWSGAHPVGVCGFSSIDMVNRTAEFSIYIDPENQKKGFGFTVMKILLDQGFKYRGFNVIWGEVFAENPALNLFEKVGFKRDGLRRDFYFRDGKFIDSHLISMKASEWAEKWT